MRPGRHLVVFVRAPVLGAVKRRLAAGIGAAAAHRFYVETTRQLLSRVAGDRRWRTWLCVTPDLFAVSGRFWPSRIPRFPQGPGGLGDRMARVLHRFRAPTVIVGSDIPDIRARHIAQAFRLLERADLVFGPAGDGGYWLVGARNAAAARGLFRNVRWSGPHALADTLANAHGRRVALLETLHDVDEAADLERIGIAPGRLSVPSAAASARRNCTAYDGYRADP